MASGDSLFTFEAIHGIPPSSTAAATPNRRGNDGHFVYDFGAATDTSLDAAYVMPRHYDGGGLTCVVMYMMATATTNAVVLNLAFERHNDDAFDLDTDGLAAANAATDTVPNVSGELGYATITFTDGADMDSIAAGEHFRMRFTRDANNGSDTAAGDLQLVAIEVRET